jgi:hypothetical protein
MISTQNVADQTPVIVSSIQFIQSDESGQPIESSLRTVDKNDGDTIRFISSIVTKPEEIPYRITMVLRGFNADNEAIQNLFTIDFTNTCGVPTFNEGERIGWVIFDKLVPASDETCPAQPLPSRQPTSYYPPGASGYSAKGSKRSSKATFSYASGRSGKNGKSKSSKGRYRNLYAVTNSRESIVEELRQEQQSKENQNESANHHLRHRM